MNADRTRPMDQQLSADHEARRVLAGLLTRFEGSWEYLDLIIRAEAEVGLNASSRGWRDGYQFGLDHAITVVQNQVQALDTDDPAAHRTAERAAEEREALGDRVVIALHNENTRPGSDTAHYRITRRGIEAQRITAAHARTRQAAATVRALGRSVARLDAYAESRSRLHREEAGRER